MVKTKVSCYNGAHAEVCPSGLRSTLGKRVSGQPFRRFESSRFRQEDFENDPERAIF